MNHPPLPSCALLIALLLSADGLRAQNPAPTPTPVPPPEPPLTIEPPPYSTFTITVTYGPKTGGEEQNQPPAAAEPRDILKGDRPVFVQIWRDDTRRRIFVRHANGVETEGYLFESGYVVRSTANSEEAFVALAEGGRGATETLYSRHFPGTQWLDMSLYKGVSQVKEGDGVKSFYLFEQPPSTSPEPVINDPNALPPPGYDALAYKHLAAKLHAPSKIPAEIRIGHIVYTFSPIQPWRGTIQMPPNFESAAERFTRERSVLDTFRRKNNR